MTRRIVVGSGLAALLLSSFLLACGNTCRSTLDCEPGEYCHTQLQECRTGCKTNADCPATAGCHVETGACRPGPGLPAPHDAGTSTSTLADAGTSTTADAG